MASEIEGMRERIVQELATVQEGQRQLARQAEELTRSNAELEQFAYVASHDLQEPLRKVASFCQALQLRYHGQLDERADQYIDFAVDGAKRMQVLINALLALSRVGRGRERRERVELAAVIAAAESSLAAEIQATGARVLAEPLPAVLGDQALLISLFQNLIGNAVAFTHSAGGSPTAPAPLAAPRAAATIAGVPPDTAPRRRSPGRGPVVLCFVGVCSMSSSATANVV